MFLALTDEAKSKVKSFAFWKLKKLRQEYIDEEILTKTKKELNYDYMCCILGLSVFVASNIFGISPIISEIILSGYKPDRDKKLVRK